MEAILQGAKLEKAYLQTTDLTGANLVFSDMQKAYLNEANLKKANLSLNMPDEETYFRDIVRKAAKRTAISQLDKYVEGRLGLVIDSTGRDYDKIKSQNDMLKQLGYDTYMIFVNTSLEVALERNKRRERRNN